MTRYSFFSIFIIVFHVFFCAGAIKISTAKNNNELISYIIPFTGIGERGHTCPGATMPFGMMKKQEKAVS